MAKELLRDLLEAVQDGPRSSRHATKASSGSIDRRAGRKHCNFVRAQAMLLAFEKGQKKPVSGVHATLIKPQVCQGAFLNKNLTSKG